MNIENPTELKLGATGMLDGRRYTVAGRVVLSVELNGETYSWNEFNLRDSGGGFLTLVYEEVEEGSPWKIFKLIDPLRPLSVPEAAAKRIGDSVDFNGIKTRVTLVGQSRVDGIEGLPPEGVEIGDVANYFNAENGAQTFVASWTGDEIEFYQGQIASNARIDGAFHLPRSQAESATKFTSSDADSILDSIGSGALKIFGFLLLLFFSVHSCERDVSPPEPRAKQMASATRLPDGAGWAFGGRTYTVAGYALVEVAAVAGKYDRYEYDLVDGAGQHALLVNSLGGDAHEWHLLTPLDVPGDFTPYVAGAVRQTRTAVVAGRSVQVLQLFRAQVLKTEDRFASTVWPDAAHYGLVARQSDEWLIARWTESRLQLLGGRVLVEKDVLGGFSAR